MHLSDLLAVIGCDLASSRGRRNWSGVGLEFQRFDTESSMETTVGSHHSVILHCTGTGTLFQRRGKRVETGAFAAGSMMLLPAGTKAYFSWNMPHSHLILNITPQMLLAASPITETEARIQLQEIFSARDTLVYRLGMSLLDELSSPDQPAQSMVVESASRALVAHLIRSFSSRDGAAVEHAKEGASLSTRHLTRVLHHIELHLGQAITLDDLAELANASRFHFTRLFKRSTGVSPMAYVEQRRIQRARDMIGEGSLTLAEIAVAVGFADQSHFTRRFHLHCGLTPAVFARSQGRDARQPKRRRTLDADIAPALVV